MALVDKAKVIQKNNKTHRRIAFRRLRAFVPPLWGQGKKKPPGTRKAFQFKKRIILLVINYV